MLMLVHLVKILPKEHASDQSIATLQNVVYWKIMIKNTLRVHLIHYALHDTCTLHSSLNMLAFVRGTIVDRVPLKNYHS